MNMSTIFDKLNDLKNLFKFGEKIVPIIQSLIEFMKEIVPLLENINSSIADTASKMPQATNQISNVTSATELATTEILDLVDQITNDLMVIEKAINPPEESKSEVSELVDELKQHVSDNEEALALVDKIAHLSGGVVVPQEANDTLKKVNESVYQITLSLQVQDITSQQLLAVNHLIQSVHDKLSTLISNIDDSDIRDEIRNLDIEVPDGATFDANASYAKDDRQDKADEIIDQQTKASQDEIDKLFG